MEKSNTAKRSQWKSKIDFLFSVLGGSIGLGNVWRFPYLCYKNGGGVFLIPYLLFVIFAAIPIFFMEASVGQFTARSPTKAWNIVPLMRGIGFASIAVIWNMCTYYQIIMAWAVQYFLASFQKIFPWSTCDNDWNSDNCFVYGDTESQAIVGNLLSVNTSLVNTSLANTTASYPVSAFCENCSVTTNESDRVSSVLEYWQRGVLGQSSGVGELGSIRPILLGCLALSWIITYFCIWKGISWTSKVVYFTASFPLVMLIILLIRGVTLPGAEQGIYYYLKPEFSKLAKTQVWIDAATQVFYSYSLSCGVVLTMGSFNDFHHNVYRDTIIFAFVNSGTSFVAGFAVFSVFGFMAHEQNSSIELVAEAGPGLVFIAFPKAVSMMPFSQLWGALFFLMIIFLGMDSQFVGQETTITSIIDLRPQFFNKPKRREIFVALSCLVQFLIGLLMITQGGVYIFNMYDNYSAAAWLLCFIGLCECVTVSWLFGINKFWKQVSYMVGVKPLPWFKFSWAVFTPALTAGVVLFGFIKYQPLTYNRFYVYPVWAQVLCWFIALSAFLWIPGYALYQICSAKGSLLERWKHVTKTPEEFFQRTSDITNISKSASDDDSDTMLKIIPEFVDTEIE